MCQKIKKTAKCLNGDIIEVEFHKGCGERGLKDAINSVRPDMYSECQQIIYDDENKDYVYVLMDTVENCIKVDVEISNDVLINTSIDRINNYNVDEFSRYIDSIDNIEDNSENIKAKNISIYWSSPYDIGRTSYTLYLIYNREKGLTTLDFMHSDILETYFYENGSYKLCISTVPKYKEEERVWFFTFKDLKESIYIKRFPSIFSSDSFIDKVQEKIDIL